MPYLVTLAIIARHTILSLVAANKWMALVGLSSHLCRLLMYFYCFAASSFVSLNFSLNKIFSTDCFSICVPDVATVFLLFLVIVFAVLLFV